MPDRTCSDSKGIADARPFMCSDSCSDHVRAEQGRRLEAGLSMDRRSDRRRLIAGKSRSTLTCVTGSAASARLGTGLHRIGIGWDGIPIQERI